MNYFELYCNPATPEHSEVLIVKFAELGFESFVDAKPVGFNAYIQEVLYTKFVEENIELLDTQFPFAKKLQLIKDENWNHEWEKNMQPINVNNKCYIRASFHPPIAEIKYDIIINPKMSFGTGHHETTYLVASQLLELDVKNKIICDMGCGTSVLAILAAKMGAASVWGVDIDDWAVENSQENIDTNNVTSVVVKKGGAELLAGKTFHVILANINRNVLLTDMNKYVQSLDEQGVLVLSGFFDVDAPAVQNQAALLEMQIVNKVLKNKWAVLCFIKKR